jgi:hypothetical protein
MSVEKTKEKYNIPINQSERKEILKESFKLRESNKEESKESPSEKLDEKILLLKGYIEGIYRLLNGKDPSIKIGDDLMSRMPLALSILSGTAFIVSGYPILGVPSLLLSIWYFDNTRKTLVSYNRITKGFIIRSSNLENSPWLDEADFFLIAVHEVAHSSKRRHFSPEDIRNAGGITKSIIQEITQDFGLEEHNILSKIKWYLVKEEYDAHIRGEIAGMVYSLLKKNPKYFGEKTEETILKIGAYIAVAEPKELASKFKDENTIIETCRHIAEQL